MKTWSKEEVSILCDKFDKLTNLELAQVLNRSIPSVKCKLQQLNLLSSRPEILVRRSNSIYRVNLKYFSLPSVENSYWAGFIAADGCVFPERNTLKITLSTKDERHLETFREGIGYTGKIYRSIVKSANIGGRKINSGSASTLCIYGCPELLVDLQTNFNIIKAKTKLMKPPSLTTLDLRAAFIKGYIDGDGSIIIGGECSSSVTLNVTGNRDLLFYIRDFCDLIAPPTRKVLSTARPVKVSKGDYFSYTLSANRAKSLLSFLYNVDSPFLERKWDKISSLLPEERSLLMEDFRT